MQERAVGQFASDPPRRWRNAALLAALALVAYAVALAATAPARALAWLLELPPQVRQLSGTVWRGEAVLSDGLVASWTVDPLASLPALALDLAWRLDGPDTRLAGAALIGISGTRVSAVDGVAGWSLVRAALPGLALACDPTARIRLDRAGVDAGRLSAVGEIVSAPGVCRGPAATPAAPPVAVPALRGRVATAADGVHLEIERRDGPGERLAEILVTPDGRMVATIQPAGARLVPGMPASAASVIEMPLGITARSRPAR